MNKNIKNILALLLSGTGLILLSSGNVIAAPVTSNMLDNPWTISFGTSYAEVFGTGAKGDLALSSASGDSHVHVGNSNLDYENTLTANASIMKNIDRSISLGFGYENIQTNVGPGGKIAAIGTDNPGSYGSYSGKLNISTMLLKARFMNSKNFNANGGMSPFLGVGVGLSNINATNQQATTGSEVNTISNNSVWRPAYMVELGGLTATSTNWAIDYGVRYTNYGKFNSGTNSANAPVDMREPVQASIYSIAPFVDVAYYF